MTNCFQATYLFAKLAVAALNCNMPSQSVIGPHTMMAGFAEVMHRACPGLKNGDPDAGKAGGAAFYNEIKTQGKASVCARIQGELIR